MDKHATYFGILIAISAIWGLIQAIINYVGLLDGLLEVGNIGWFVVSLFFFQVIIGFLTLINAILPFIALFLTTIIPYMIFKFLKGGDK